MRFVQRALVFLLAGWMGAGAAFADDPAPAAPAEQTPDHEAAASDEPAGEQSRARRRAERRRARRLAAQERRRKAAEMKEAEQAEASKPEEAAPIATPAAEDEKPAGEMPPPKEASEPEATPDATSTPKAEPVAEESPDPRQAAAPESTEERPAPQTLPEDSPASNKRPAAEEKPSPPEVRPAPEEKPAPRPAPRRERAREAILDPAEAGPDFAVQGEYGGFVSEGFFSREIGVQVIALGDGKFDAVVYEGGLPGAGWNGRQRSSPPAELRDGALYLADGLRTLILIGNRGTVHDQSGAQTGWLRKIRRVSRTMGAAPPPGATVLFDGASLEAFRNAKMTDDGLLLAGALMNEEVGDFRLHLEFCTPFMPYARGQGRGNSGVYIQQRYEVQILDSFGLEGIENECGSLYRQKRPEVNMCLPPLSWQTYDIEFRQARWDADGNKTAPARITVLHNGVPIHNNYDIPAKTGAGRPESPERGRILLQDHSNPVRFRNIWLAPLPEPATYPYASSAPAFGLPGAIREGRRPLIVAPHWRGW